MKTLYLFGNHKMNLTKKELVNYFKQLNNIANQSANVVGVAVSSPYLCLAQKYLANGKVKYGAQNVHFNEKGTHTGEVSVAMLQDFDSNICLVGHSERRAQFNESGVEINKKIKALLNGNITPILCFGETFEARQNHLEYKVVTTQLDEALQGIDNIKNIIFAYEPVWAISSVTSANASTSKSFEGDTIKQMDEITKYIKKYLCEKYNVKKGDIVLLYGGSLNPKNAQDLLSKSCIDGGLIGGACLNAESFGSIINTIVK